jgi:hypothetical protein
MHVVVNIIGMTIEMDTPDYDSAMGIVHKTIWKGGIAHLTDLLTDIYLVVNQFKWTSISASEYADRLNDMTHATEQIGDCTYPVA